MQLTPSQCGHDVLSWAPRACGRGWVADGARLEYVLLPAFDQWHLRARIRGGSPRVVMQESYFGSLAEAQQWTACFEALLAAGSLHDRLRLATAAWSYMAR